MTLRDALIVGGLVTIATSVAFADVPCPEDASTAAARSVVESNVSIPAGDSKPESNSAPAEAEPEARNSDAKKSDAELVMEMQAAGYKIVNERGTQLFCKTDDILGSRLRKKTRCLTAAEIEQEHQAASDTLSEMSRKSFIPPNE